MSNEHNKAHAVPQGWTDADSDAARLALELECLLLDTETLSVVSKWWASANEALELHRQRLATLAAPSQEPAVPQGNDQAWTLAAKVREALDRKACPGYYMDVAVEAVVHNYTPAAPSQGPVTDEYAGVIAWVGDKQCKRVITEGAIKHEHTPGVAMRNAAHQCVQEVIITAQREKDGK